jgi:hypothetical protein
VSEGPSDPASRTGNDASPIPERQPVHNVGCGQYGIHESP